jgi:ABC-type sugar transport system permease subunit
MKNKQVRSAWVMSAPALIILFLFLVIPFLLAFMYSFTNRMLLMNPNNSVKFIGLTNYIRLFHDEEFYKALTNNLTFAAVVVPIQTVLALLMAVLINSKLKGINLFRTVFFSPVVITMVVVSIVWALILIPTPDGYLNSVLSTITFGLFKPSQWLHSENSSMLSIIILSIWQGVGFQMVIFLAGLQYIPKELYEAAEVDGANTVQKFFKITIPQLKNTTIFVIISTTIFAFKLFTQVMVLTEGGPKSSTTTMVYMLYREGFTKKKVGYASAIAVVFFIIVLTISMLQNKFIRED